MLLKKKEMAQTTSQTEHFLLSLNSTNELTFPDLKKPGKSRKLKFLTIEEKIENQMVRSTLLHPWVSRGPSGENRSFQRFQLKPKYFIKIYEAFNREVNKVPIAIFRVEKSYS